MRKVFRLGWLFLFVIGLTVCACSDDNAPGEDENTENNGGGNDGEDGSDDGEGGSDVPTAIKPSMDEETLKFVGCWDGMGPATSPNYKLVEGTWSFFNDGTCHWTDGEWQPFEMKGKWHYNAEKKMLVTDCDPNFNWQIEEVSGDMWVGTLLNTKGGTYTYRRKEAASVACSNVRIIDYKPGEFVVKDTIRNYGTYSGTLKCGVCYSLRDAKEDIANYQRVYATKIATDTLLREETLGKKLCITTQGVFQVELKSLQKDGQYNLCNFIEFEDGNVIYGKGYVAKCVTLPEDAVYLGEEVKDGKIRCWAKGYLHADGKIDDGVLKSGSDQPVCDLNVDEATSMLTSLGDGWRLPEVNDMETLVYFVNNYAVEEYVPNQSGDYHYDVTFKSLINRNTLNFTFKREDDPKYSWTNYYTFRPFMIDKYKVANTYADGGGFSVSIDGSLWAEIQFALNNWYGAPDKYWGSPYLRPIYEVRVQ